MQKWELAFAVGPRQCPAIRYEFSVFGLAQHEHVVPTVHVFLSEYQCVFLYIF